VSTARFRAGRSKTAAAAVAVLVVLLAAGAYLFLPRAPPTQTETSVGPPTVQVQTEVDQMLADLNARDVDALTTFYGPTSVVHWSGNTGGLSGLYTGAESIRLIYATSVGKTTTMDANLSDYSQKVFSPTHLNATFVIHMLANSSEVGTLTAVINASQEWNWGGSGWQISRENWAYTYFDGSLIDLEHGGPSTTFPQWQYSLKGGNPDLVSEKSFEWHAAPYIASSVYALLAGVGAIASQRLARGRGRQAVDRQEGARSETGQ